MTFVQIVALVAACIAGFIAVWAMLMPLIAWFSGWRRLAEEFRAAPETRGRIVLGTATLRYGAHYNNIIRLDCRPSGLVLSVRGPFRLAHPPLLIPWPQIRAEEISVLWMIPATRLELGSDAHIPFTFLKREARELVTQYASPHPPGEIDPHLPGH